MHKIVSVGSVDGVLTSAALIRFLQNKGIQSEILFTQAFTCQQILPMIEDGDRVWLVDLAVNNKDPEYTKLFIEEINKRATLVGVVDEHDAYAWGKILGKKHLTVYPKTRSEEFPSSGAVLFDALYQEEGWDDWCTLLTSMANLADRGFFRGLARDINKAVKANIKCQERRAYLANHYALFDSPDDKIQKWIEEYEELEKNSVEVLDNSFSDGVLYFFDSRDRKIDRTSILRKLDSMYPDCKVAVCRGQAYDRERGGLFPCYTFMVRNGKINLKELIPFGWGMEQVINVEDAQYQEALDLLTEGLNPVVDNS